MDWQSEFFGGSATLALPGNLGVIAPPSRFPGTQRYLRANPTALSVAVMHRGDLMPNGRGVVIHNANASNFLVVLDQGANILATILPQTVCEFYQTAQSANGSWTTIASSAAEGSSLAFNRVPLDLTIGEDVKTFNLRRHHDAFSTYDGVTPAALRMWFGTPSKTFLMGADDPTDAEDGAAFDTGEWPAGTTLLLFNYGRILGRGGDGGRGGDVPPGLLSAAGGAGTTAMRIRVNTALVNFGVIAGGGGGGAGGAYQSTTPGGGGGGGQGYIGGRGGQPGGPVGGYQSVGVDGGAFHAGGGGTGGFTGGTGGGLGTAGFVGPSGGTGGAAGSAILRKSAVTVTKVVAGTITGAEGTF